MLDVYCSICIIFHFQTWHYGRDHHQNAKHSYWRSATTNISRAWSATLSSGCCHIRSWSCLPRNCTAQNGWSAAVRDRLVWIYAIIIHYNRVVYHLRKISWVAGASRIVAINWKSRTSVLDWNYFKLFLGRPPGPEMENAVNRESYSLAAGLALGLVMLEVTVVSMCN